MYFEKVKEVIAEQLNISADSIEMESLIKQDLGADSLDVIDILMNLEDAYLIDIPDDRIDATVADLVSFVEAAAQEKVQKSA